MKGTIVAVVVVIAGLVAAVYFSHAFSESYDTKLISHSTNFDPSITQFYVGEFRVLSSEVQVDRAPEVLFEITVFDSGNDNDIGIHYAIFGTDRATYNSLNETARESFLLDSRNRINRVNDRMILQISPMTYTWVIWYQAEEKTSSWSIDILLTLIYNWGLN